MPRKSNEARKSKSIQLHMTDAMYANLVRLAGSDNSRELADLIRQAVRYYFDNHPDITGSRRYFTRRFQDSLTKLDNTLFRARWSDMTIIIMLLYAIAHMVHDLRYVSDPNNITSSTSSVLNRIGRHIKAGTSENALDSILDATKPLRDDIRKEVDEVIHKKEREMT